MATTSLTAIMTAIRAVLEAAPLSLHQSSLPFSFDRLPNVMVQDAYCLEPGTLVSGASATNDVEVRVHRLIVWVAKPLAFDGIAQLEALVDLGDDIYRYLSANGRANGWNIEQDGHQVQQPKNSNLIIGRFSFTVDFDFSSATS